MSYLLLPYPAFIEELWACPVPPLALGNMTLEIAMTGIVY